MKRLLCITLCVAVFLVVIPISAGAESTLTPIAFYNFDNSYNIGKDVSGNGNDLAVFGSPVQCSGKYGNGVSFDGASSLYASTNASGLDFIDLLDSTTDQITIGYWAKFSASDFLSSDWRRIIDNGSNGGLGYGGFSMLSLIGDNIYNPVINIDSADTTYVANGNWATYGYTEEWHYLTWTFDAANSVSIFYVNGTPIFYNDYTYTSKLSNANALFSIGAQTISAAFDNNMRLVQPSKGLVDDVAVFDRMLSAEEIGTLINNGYTPSVGAYENEEPVAYYDFDNANNLGHDNSVNGNDLTAFGTPTQGAGIKGGSAYFDGASALYAGIDGAHKDFVDKMTSATISFWVNTTSSQINLRGPGSWNRVVDNGFNGAFIGGFSMVMLADGGYMGPIVGLSDSTGGSFWADGNSSWLVNGGWTQLTLTIDGVKNKVAFYANGALLSQKSLSYTPSLSCLETLFSIGSQTISDGNGLRILGESFVGNVDELMVFDKCMSPVEVSKLCYDTNGDNNMDGAINVIDMIALRNGVIGIGYNSFSSKISCDINNDGNIDIWDILYLKTLIMSAN